MKHELCCIGHITLDKVTTSQQTIHMPGGTSYYVSHAGLSHFHKAQQFLTKTNPT